MMNSIIKNKIRLFFYKNIDDREALRDKSFTNKLSHDIPRPFKLEGIKRVDDSPLHKIVREALLNTLVNADYYGSRGIVIKKYPNGFTFENPGNFRIGVKEAMSGGVSDPRNAILFKMFALIDLGERAGSGIPTIIEGWKATYGEVPQWEDIHNPDRTVLRLHCNDLSEVLLEKSSIDVFQKEFTGDKKAMILDYISKNGEVKTSDIVEAFGIKSSQSRYYLRTLVEDGLIESCGSNKNRTYKAKE